MREGEDEARFLAEPFEVLKHPSSVVGGDMLNGFLPSGLSARHYALTKPPDFLGFVLVLTIVVLSRITPR
jgi:hypothetical protein